MDILTVPTLCKLSATARACQVFDRLAIPLPHLNVYYVVLTHKRLLLGVTRPTGFWYNIRVDVLISRRPDSPAFTRLAITLSTFEAFASIEDCACFNAKQSNVATHPVPVVVPSNTDSTIAVCRDMAATPKRG